MGEEAGHEIQKARYATIDEDDFLPDGVVVALLLPAPPKTKASQSTAAITTSTQRNRSPENAMK